MTIIDIIKMASKNLARRKMRTFLTVLGVIIGTAAIVVMLSLGFGLDENQRQSMERWGSLNIIRVYPGQAWDREGNPIGDAKVLNEETVAELKLMPGITAISPAFEIYGEASWGRKQGHMPIVGIDPSQMEKLEFGIDQGRLITSTDRLQIVVGSEVVNNFWDDSPRGRGGNMYEAPPRSDPSEMLGERIAITLFNNNQEKRVYNFTVVGILDEKNMERSWQAFGSLEDVRRMNDFMKRGSANNNNHFEAQVRGRDSQDRNKENTYSFVLIRTDDIGVTKELSSQLREMGFNAHSMADALEGIEQSSRIIQAVLGGIGSITLLVAALGITNTMIMSIYERTREIGIIKVIGASSRDIKLMFLTEATLIGLFGGIIGLVISFATSSVLNNLAESYIGGGMGGMDASISIIPPFLALFAIVFSMLIGLVAGFFPANRAIKLSPIDAIRQS